MTRRVGPVATCVVALVATAACTGGGSSGGGSSEGPAPPGLTSTQITIGSTQPLSGVASAGYSEIALASAAYFKYVNDSGGINNRTIDYRYVDDRYNPGRTAVQTRKLVGEDVFAMFDALGTATHQKVVDLLNNRHVPDVFVGSGCPCWDRVHAHPYTFGWQPSYTVEGKILGAYIRHNIPRKKKVALFYQDDDFGRSGARGVAHELSHKRIVSRQSYRPGTTDISKQVRRLQAAKADVIVSFSVPAFTAILRLNMLRLKYDAKLVVSSAGSDPTTLAGVLKAIAVTAHQKVDSVKLIQGIVTDTFLPSPANTDNSWVQLFRKVHDKYIPKLPFDGNVEYGMAAAYTFAEALRAAGPDPTRDGLVAAIERGLPAGPGLTPLRYSATSHEGYSGVQVGVIRGRALSLLGTPATTDSADGPVRPYDRPQPTAPADGIPPG